MRLVIPQIESDATAILTMAMNSAEATDKIIPVIFDINVFIQTVYSPHSDDIWKAFEELRRIKNDIFFNSLTEAAMELFQ